MKLYTVGSSTKYGTYKSIRPKKYGVTEYNLEFSSFKNTPISKWQVKYQ